MRLFSPRRYHVKYMFTGDMVKTELEGLVRQMRPPLRRRLRFITHMSEEGPNVPAEGSARAGAGAESAHGGAASHPAPSPAGGRPVPGMPPSPFVSGN